MSADLPSSDLEPLLEQWFTDNLKVLSRESGHRLSPTAQQAAWRQVLAYWHKLGPSVAARITETEVRLTLPGRLTPKQRRFNLEGVVDIVQDGERTVLYDLKTHDLDQVRADPTRYQGQLNLYAHIWRHLQHRRLDGTAILCTALPRSLDTAARRHLDHPSEATETALRQALAAWDPVVPMDFDDEAIQATLADFDTVVDAIEDGCFPPPAAERLSDDVASGVRESFAVQVCANCDARFSCASYRQYTRRARPSRATQDRFPDDLDDHGPEDDEEAREAWMLATLAERDPIPD